MLSHVRVTKRMMAGERIEGCPTEGSFSAAKIGVRLSLPDCRSPGNEEQQFVPAIFQRLSDGEAGEEVASRSSASNDYTHDSIFLTR